MTIYPDSPHIPLTYTNLAYFSGPISMLPGTSTIICCLSDYKCRYFMDRSLELMSYFS